MVELGSLEVAMRASESDSDVSNDEGEIAAIFDGAYAQFQDGEGWLDYLKCLGLLTREYYCPTCGRSMTCARVQKGRCGDGRMWRCRKDNVWRSVRKGTWFEKSKLSISVIVSLTNCFCYRMSPSKTSEKLELCEKSVLDWFSECRRICTNLVEKRGKIGGPCVAVNIDVTSFSSLKKVRGKIVPELWVWGAVVCGDERGGLIMRVMERNNAKSFWSLIEKHIDVSSLIVSDKFKYYREEAPETSEVGLKFIITESRNGAMEQHWKNIRRVVGRGKRRQSVLQGYLDEYVWRQSFLEGGSIFDSFMRGVASQYVPYKTDATSDEA